LLRFLTKTLVKRILVGSNGFRKLFRRELHRCPEPYFYRSHCGSLQGKR
jgi:hypothetical protein